MHASHSNVRIDVTAKAQRRGLCPARRDVMVMMDQPLMNEVARLNNDVLSTPHWLDRLDAFIDHARDRLAAAPKGCRSFDFDITATPGIGERQPLRIEIHVEIERCWNKHALVFSLAGRQRLAA